MITKCYIQGKHFRFKGTNRLKAKTYLNRNQKREREKAGVATRQDRH